MSGVQIPPGGLPLNDERRPAVSSFWLKRRGAFGQNVASTSSGGYHRAVSLTRDKRSPPPDAPTPRGHLTSGGTVKAATLLLLVQFLAACSLPGQTAEYKVTGSGSAQISYVDGGAQSGTHDLPFRVTVTAPAAPNQFFLTATSDEELTCTLTVNGEVVARQTGRIVSCSG